MSKIGTWGDGVMLSGAELLYKRPISLFLSLVSNPVTIAPEMTHFNIEPIYLGYTSIGSDKLRNHYVSLIPEHSFGDQCPTSCLDSWHDPIIVLTENKNDCARISKLDAPADDDKQDMLCEATDRPTGSACVSHFTKMKAQSKISQYSLHAIKLPRHVRAPSRYEQGKAQAHVFESSEILYRV